MIKLVAKENFINKIWSPRQSDHFEIAAATLLMTVNLASKSGKRYRKHSISGPVTQDFYRGQWDFAHK